MLISTMSKPTPERGEGGAYSPVSGKTNSTLPGSVDGDGHFQAQVAFYHHAYVGTGAGQHLRQVGQVVL